MYWYARFIGGFLGWLVAGPLGLFFGICLGYFFDQGLTEILRSPPQRHFNSDTKNVQDVYFNTVFTVMGYLAKVDGRVSENEIKSARKIMGKLGLNEQLRLKAIESFTVGKQQNFNVNNSLAQFFSAARGNESLLLMFLEIMVESAHAEGNVSLPQRRALMAIANQLGFSANDMARLEAMYRAQQQFYHYSEQHTQNHAAHSPTSKIQAAYAVLGVDENASEADIRRSYRRLMSQHHPDKLMSKGLPEDMIKMATQKTQDIKRAYELIRKWRGKNK